MSLRSIRRAVSSAAILETVELRRLLSVAPDATFGASGVVHYTDDLPASAQYDQIVSASSATGITSVAEITDFSSPSENLLIVRRFSPSGSAIDSDTVTLPFSASDSLVVTDVAVDAANNVYVAGNRADSDLGTTIGFVVRIDSSGSFDSSFGVGTGSISTSELSMASPSVQLAINGGTIYAGYAIQGAPGFLTAQIKAFDPSGAPNLSYGAAGTSSTVLPIEGTTVNELLVDGSGLLVVGTSTDSDDNGDNNDPESIYVARIDGAGLLDSGYATNGYGVSAPIDFYNVNLSGVTRVAGGFVVAGSNADGQQILVKLDSSLDLDPTFDDDGVLELSPATLMLSPFDRSTRSIVSDADGKVYVLGITSPDGSDFDLSVVAFTSTGTIDPTFGTGGVYTFSEAPADIGIGLATDASGDLLVSGLQIGADGLQTGLLIQLAEPVVANTPPSVAGVTTAGSVQTNVVTSFSSSFSDADAGDTFTITWNFGDGHVVTSTQTAQGTITASHAYTTSSTYSVTVTVTDSAGNAVSSAGSIVVTAPPPPVPYTVVGGQLSLTSSGNVELVKSGANYVLTVNGTPYTISGGLNSAVITGGTGNDFIRVSTQITIPVTLVGGAGHDTLRGGSGNDVIVGDEGNDLIIGRDGQDLMIGGNGADFLIGREDSDLLISGTTTLSGNLTALKAIMAEWTSNHNILIKLANVTGILPLPGRLNGSFYLTPDVTVFGDNSVDTLSGGDGTDLYYISLFGLNSDIVRDNQTSFAANVASLVFGD
jgi:PKD repeat protein